MKVNVWFNDDLTAMNYIDTNTKDSIIFTRKVIGDVYVWKLEKVFLRGSWLGTYVLKDGVFIETLSNNQANNEVLNVIHNIIKEGYNTYSIIKQINTPILDLGGNTNE